MYFDIGGNHETLLEIFKAGFDRPFSWSMGLLVNIRTGNAENNKRQLHMANRRCIYY